MPAGPPFSVSCLPRLEYAAVPQHGTAPTSLESSQHPSDDPVERAGNDDQRQGEQGGQSRARLLGDAVDESVSHSAH
jgi:hypothetical protein